MDVLGRCTLWWCPDCEYGTTAPTDDHRCPRCHAVYPATFGVVPADQHRGAVEERDEWKRQAEDWARVHEPLRRENESLRQQLEGAVEDAKDADEASMQAAFWRARAIELGASEGEYRERHRERGQ